MNSDYVKYIENKRAYLNISKQIGGNTKYYVIHFTDYKNLLEILKTKLIKSNEQIDKKYWRMSGDVSSKYVFASIIKSNNKIENFGIGFIFDERILYNKSFIFNSGWIGEPTNDSIVVDPNKKNIHKELQRIRKIISNKRILDYEILFYDRLSLEYLIGIHMPKCTEKKVNKIKRLLRENKMENVNVYANETIYLDDILQSKHLM
jgi:hypothetical protein